MRQHAILRRAPGKIDLAFFDRHPLPFARKLEIRPVEPPDVFAAPVDQLDLKMVARRIGAQVERDFVIRGQVEWQCACGERVARGSRKIEIESQRRAVDTGCRANRRANTVGRSGLPWRKVREIVEHSHSRDRRLRPKRNARCDRDEQQRDARHAGVGHRKCMQPMHRHALTLPAIRPCT